MVSATWLTLARSGRSCASWPRTRPDLGSSWITAERVSSYAELSQAMAPVGTVVATRYHNVICAVQLGSRPYRSGTRGRTSC